MNVSFRDVRFEIFFTSKHLKTLPQNFIFKDMNFKGSQLRVLEYLWIHSFTEIYIKYMVVTECLLPIYAGTFPDPNCTCPGRQAGYAQC